MLSELGIPFVGLLIDRLPFLYVMVVALFLGSGFGLLGMATTPSLQILGFGCFVVFRPLLYTAVSEAIAKICGFESFGTICMSHYHFSPCEGVSLTSIQTDSQ